MLRAAVAHPYSLALRRIRAELQHRAAAAGPSQAAADRAVLGAREPDARVLAGNPSQRASPIDSVPSACLAVRFVCRLNRFRIAEAFPRHRSGARTVLLLAAARTMPRKMRIRCARHMAALHCDCCHSVQQGSALRTQRDSGLWSRGWIRQGVDSVSAPFVVLFFNDEPKAFACLHQLVLKLMPRVKPARPPARPRHVRHRLAVAGRASRALRSAVLR
jgi:hypothetical protein